MLVYNSTGKYLAVKHMTYRREAIYNELGHIVGYENDRIYGGTVGTLYPGEMFSIVDKFSAGEYLVGFYSPTGYRYGVVFVRYDFRFPGAFTSRTKYWTKTFMLGGTQRAYHNVFSVQRATNVYLGAGYKFALKAGDAIGISGSDSASGDTYPWRLSIDSVRRNGVWTKLGSGYWADTGNFSGRTMRKNVNLLAKY